MQPNALADVVALAIKTAVAPVLARVSVLETQLAEARAALDVKDLYTRVAVLETRAPVPGPAGVAGVDGVAGKDGADGLGFDDLDIVHDGERGVIVRFARGERVKESTIVFPCLLYRGVFALGHTYNAGDIVTHGGSAWHCNKATATKPDTAEGAGFWKLMVKRGDRGRDVREATTTPSLVRAMR